MKSRITTFMLITVLAVIWGIIAQKIFFDNTIQIVSEKIQQQIVTKQDKSFEQELQLNYRDPFLDEVPQQQSIAATKQNNTVVHREQINAKYVGRLRKGKTDYYLIESNGAGYSLRKGETLDDFILTNVSKDSIHFAKDGYTYCIKLTQ